MERVDDDSAGSHGIDTEVVGEGQRLSLRIDVTDQVAVGGHSDRHALHQRRFARTFGPEHQHHQVGDYASLISLERVEAECGTGVGIEPHRNALEPEWPR